MFLRTLHNLRHSLALRLTVWYAGIFAATSTLAFVLAYALLVSIVQERTDEDLEDDLGELAGFMELGGLGRVETEIMIETEGEEAEDEYFRIWASDGRLLMATDLSSWPGLREPRRILPRLNGADEPILETLALPQREHDVRVIYGPITPGVILELGQSLEDVDEFIEAFLIGFLITLAVVVVLGGPIGWFLARRALRGVEEVTCTATEIANGALDRRVTVRSRGDELERLAQTFNNMLDRIQALIVGMREMTDNLAHDLRSPLGRIRAAAEMALAAKGSKADWESLAIGTTEECDRLLEMINTTLDIAEAESGAVRLRIADIDLVTVVLDACELFQTVAEDKQITLTTNLPAQCLVQGDLQRLQRVVANLLDNALKYTPTEGQVAIGLVEEKHTVALSVEDTGVGMSADELPHIFRRFYRCDHSRSERGNGLGLSLALALVRAHGGDIRVSSNAGQGSTFTVVLARSLPGRWLSRRDVQARSEGEPEDFDTSDNPAV